MFRWLWKSPRIMAGRERETVNKVVKQSVKRGAFRRTVDNCKTKSYDLTVCFRETEKF